MSSRRTPDSTSGPPFAQGAGTTLLDEPAAPIMDLFNDRDRKQMAGLGIDPEEAARQVELLRNPPPATRVDRPCRPGDGIRVLPEASHAELVEHFDLAATAGQVAKLVPASGAASRMFRSLIACLGGERPGEKDEADEVETFFANLERFAFIDALRDAMAKHGLDLDERLRAGDRESVLEHLLTERGLGYAELPKGLVMFHRYRLEPRGGRTAFEEHLVEAVDSVRDDRGTCRLHVTVSPQHESAFRTLLLEVRRPLEQRYGVELAVSFSSQSRSTDTLAVDPEGLPFRSDDGSLLFRPGGHGALVGNLQKAAEEAPVLLIRNIDNVLPDGRREVVTRWSRLLIGELLRLRRRAWSLLERLDTQRLSDVELAPLLDEAATFLAEELSRPLSEGLARLDAERRRRELIDRLDRPLRVCGVVQNLGEPGGGPFWVVEPSGELTLQIVETSQIDQRDPSQREALAASTHFSPTHLACAVTDRHGRPYDLGRFVDPATAFVTDKSHEGRPLKALERPGLWNGAMAGWNTVFVEEPDETFAPVKTVLDLLRPEHQTG